MYEYKVLNHQIHKGDEFLQDLINNEAQDDWRLTHVLLSPSSLVSLMLVMERPARP